jgi:hypothetical protein
MQEMTQRLHAAALPAVWLPFLGGLLPLVGTLVALTLSQQMALIPVCNPLIDGCVSISRAARYDLPNYLFRALLLPAAVLQALTWWFAAQWLRQHGARERLLAWLPWVGVTAACFLVLYGTFLGTEGEAYRWMRRYGVIVYFGCTCLAMVISAGLMQRHLHAHPVLRLPARLLLALTYALPLMGLVTALRPLYLPDGNSGDVVENVMEWWAGVIFTLFFLVLAWCWLRLKLRLTLQTG